MTEWRNLWRALWSPSAPLTPTLIKDEVSLRPIILEDYAAWHGVVVRDKEHLQPWQPQWSSTHLSLDAYRQRMRLYEGEARRALGFAFHIFIASPEGKAQPERFVGAIRLAPIQYGAARSGCVGYWIAQPDWGHGYGTKALQAATQFAFERLALMRLEAHCLPENQASQRVLEKAGFSQEGLLQQFLEIDGVRQDHFIYGKTA